jgi:serine/threonine protein kinase
VTNRVPFVGRTPIETGAMQCLNPVPPMSQFRPDTPQVLQELVDRALAKDPAQRFPDAAALLQALESLPIGRKTPVSSASNEGKSGGLPDEAETAPGGDGGEVHEEGIIQRVSHQTPAFDADEERALAYLYFEPEIESEVSHRFAIKRDYVIIGRIDPKRGITPEIDLNAVDSQMTVSRQHARIRCDKGAFTIEDLKSHNKTRLRGLALEPLKVEALQDGDVVHFGSVRMVFRTVGAQGTTLVD